MPKKPAPKLRADVVETAFRVMQEATGQALPAQGPKNPDAVARRAKGGEAGGKARAAKLSPEARAEIAEKAALKRWENR